MLDIKQAAYQPIKETIRSQSIRRLSAIRQNFLYWLAMKQLYSDHHSLSPTRSAVFMVFPHQCVVSRLMYIPATHHVADDSYGVGGCGPLMVIRYGGLNGQCSHGSIISDVSQCVAICITQSSDAHPCTTVSVLAKPIRATILLLWYETRYETGH